MKTRSTLICGIALASVALAFTGCSKKKSSSSSSTVASSTSSSTTVITSGSTGATTSSSTGNTNSSSTSPPTPPLANTGTGTFIDGSASLPSSTTDDFGVAAGDFDGDGDQDLMIAANSAASRVLENDGGTFTVKAGAFPGIVMRATDVHARDLDQDGDLDLIVASNMEPIRVFKNDGTGTFTLSGSFVTNNDTFTYKIAVADFDGDGYDDVFMGNAGLNAPSAGQNRLLINDTSGAFKEATAGSVPNRDDDTIGIAPIDFDGDGDLDVFVANFGTAHRLLVNDGKGGFTDGSDTFLPPKVTYGTSVAVADFDQDGYADVFIGSEGAPSASRPPQGEQNALFLGSQGGTFSDASATLPQLVDTTFGLVSLDANGDGAPDIAISNLRGLQGLYLNVNGRLVNATANLPSSNTTSDSLGCTSADFNGDRAPDLIFLQRNATPKLFLNVPKATTTAGATSPAPAAPRNTNLSPI